VNSNRLVFGLGLVGLILLAAAVVLVQPSFRSAPKDRELIALFYAHHHEFEKLKEMATEDATRGWYLGHSEESALDDKRQLEYSRYISAILPGLRVVMSYHWLRFMFAHEGVAIGPSWVKGIEYVPPANYGMAGIVLTNLDKAPSLSAGTYLRKIEPDWFVFYQRDE